MAPRRSRAMLCFMKRMLLALAFVLVAASSAHADDSTAPPPAGGTKDLAIGISLLATSYALSVVPTIGADVGNNHNFDALYAPIAGPFVAAVQMFVAGTHETGMFASLGTGVDDMAGIVFILDGIAQVAGAIEIGVGVAKNARPHRAARVQVTPLVSRSIAGVGASFAF